MKTPDRQKLDVVNQTRSNLFGWRGQFTLEFKPLEFEGFGNCGEFATIKLGWNVASFNSLEFEGFEPRGAGSASALIPSNSAGLGVRASASLHG